MILFRPINEEKNGSTKEGKPEIHEGSSFTNQ